MEYIILKNMNTLVSLLTSDILSTAINDTSNLIVSIFTDDYKNYPDLTYILKDLDVIYKLNVIKNIIKIIPKKYEKIECIKTALLGVKDIIHNIYILLIKIINIINIHKLKYLSYFRKINYKNELNELKLLIKLLDNRLYILLELIKLFKIK